MPGNEIDDIAIKKEAVDILKQNWQRIKDVFQVEIASGFLSDDGVQWVELCGKQANRKEAKDYIKALCSPAEKIDMEYSTELYPLLSNPSVHRKLEKQSNAVIIFPARGILSIRGSDTLSVTLALSAVEELINKYLNQETSLAAGQLSPGTNLSSQRLDDELRRLSTENQSIVIEDDYYSNANDAVKRTILSWMKDDSILEHEEGDSEDVTEAPQNTTNFESPRSAYNQSTSDFNSNVKSIPVKVAGVNAHGTGVHSVSPVKKSSSNSDIELLTPDTFVTKRTSSSSTATAISLPLPNLPNVSSSTSIAKPSQFGYSRTSNQATEDAKSKDYLLAVGLQSDFSEEDIELVFKRHGTQLTKKEFLRYAMNIKSDRELAKAYTNSVPIGGATAKSQVVDLSPILNNFSSSNSVINNKLIDNKTVIDLTISPSPNTSSTKYYSYPESSKPSTSQKQNEEQGEDYLLAYGLEHNFSEEDIQSVFEKYGTSMTTIDFDDRACKVKSDRAKEKALSSNLPKTLFPKPPTAEEMASNKLQPEILKNKKHMDHYFSQLQRDFKEEDNCEDVDELKMRNFERQRLLREAYEKAGKEGTEVNQQENWDEGMDVGFSEVENKKRKHKNSEKASGPRKSRWSPVDANIHAGESQEKKNRNKNKSKHGGQNKHNITGNNAKPGPSNHRSPTDTGKNTKPGHSNQWSPTDDRTNFGDLFISKNKGGYDNVHVPGGSQPNPFHQGNKEPMRGINSTEPMHIGQNKSYTRDRTNRSPSPKGAIPKKQNISRSPQNMLNSRSSPRNIPETASGMPAPTITLRSNLRYIVIDGSNVAFHHGNHQVFSCKGIEIVVNYFLKRGHTEVTAFVPQWRTRTVQNDPIEDQHLLEDLRKKGYLVYTPARKIGGKNIRTHDDNFVLRLAVETDGIVVTNDNFRDHFRGRPDWRDVIENRLLMYSFVGDFFMPPEDPMGPYGPTLDDFLRKDIDFTNRQGYRDRPHSGSPKTDRQRYSENTRTKNHQPLLPTPVVTVATRHTHSQPTWQQVGIPGQQGRHGMGQKGRGEHQGNNMSSQGAAGGKMQHLQNTSTLTWQQQLLNENKPNQQQGSRQQNKRPNGQGSSQTTNTGPPVRTDEQTSQLFHELKNIFPGELVKIQRILQNHARETDLQKLSIHLLDIIDET